MSFLDTLKQDALAIFQATANALHAQLANTLSQAGHPVTEADHVDTLVQTAVNASTGAANAAQAVTTAPNYADAALATFSTAMTSAAVQFAQAHLPAKFQGVAADAVGAVSNVVAGGTPSVATAVSAAAGIAASVGEALAPQAAPLISAAEAIVEQFAHAGDAAPSSSEPAPATNQNGV